MVKVNVMKYTQLGQSKIKVSQLGFGTRLLYRTNFKSPKEFDELINTAIHYGINILVGAGHYSGGEAEKFLGDALEPYRKKIILATSVGVRHTKENITISLSVQLVKQQLEQSLKNLNTDYIDLFQLHYYDPTCDLKELNLYLQELYDSQVFRAFGVSNFRLQEIKEWDGVPISSLQMPYNPLQREIEGKYVQLCLEKHISLLTYMPLCGGIFTDKNAQATNLNPYEEFLPSNKIELIKTLLHELYILANELEVTINDLVLSWLATKSFISSILLGTTNIDHLKTNIAALSETLSADVSSSIEKILNAFWSNFPEGITIPIKVEKIIELHPGKWYTNIYGNLIPIPNSIKIGDIVLLNDTLGEIVANPIEK